MSNEEDPVIDGFFVESMILKSTRASACRMCGFVDWAPGDTRTKYVVEGDHYREHLCPICVVSRGLDYDTFYKQNKNAPISTKDQIKLTATAYRELQERKSEYDQEGLPAKKRYKSDDSNDMTSATSLCVVVAKHLHEANIPGCVIRPHSETPLFVAWNGVLVMVYEGFPPSLLQAKHVVETSLPNLQPEKFGSKWPKTTLATAFDSAPALPLEELTRLRTICNAFSRKILELKAKETTASLVQDISKISLVTYKCRSLEMLQSKVDVSLTKNGYDRAQACNDQKTIVNAVVHEWDNLQEYAPKVNAPGSRMSSYRKLAKGATCVAFLDPFPDPLRQTMTEFRIAVDVEFPAHYAWMAEKSLHCTLRSLDTVENS